MAKGEPPLISLRYETEASSCPGCGSPRIALLDAFKITRDRRGRRLAFLTGCRECGLLFANPLPSREDLERHYSDDGAWAAGRKRRAGKPEASRSDPREQLEVLFAALAAHVPIDAPPPGARVLDFGCGGGKFLDRLQDAGWETYGVEPSTNAAFARHRRLDVVPQDGSFDFVILHHVLEHVTEPLAILRQLAGATREGGTLFVGVPRLDTLPQHGDAKYCLDGRHHVICASDVCLTGLLARAGFAVTARLDSPALDQALTGGRPLRLRLLARRVAGHLPTPEAPLARAVEAWRRHVVRKEGWSGRLARALPVRLRAARLDRAIERRARQRRAARS